MEIWEDGIKLNNKCINISSNYCFLININELVYFKGNMESFYIEIETVNSGTYIAERGPEDAEGISKAWWGSMRYWTSYAMK